MRFGYSLEIHVDDPSGAVIPDAEITLTYAGNAQPQRAQTDRTGKATLQVRTEPYDLLVSAPAFTTAALHVVRYGPTYLRFVLDVGFCSPCVTIEPPYLPLVSTPIEALLPLPRPELYMPLLRRRYRPLK